MEMYRPSQEENHIRLCRNISVMMTQLSFNFEPVIDLSLPNASALCTLIESKMFAMSTLDRPPPFPGIASDVTSASGPERRAKQKAGSTV